MSRGANVQQYDIHPFVVYAAAVGLWIAVAVVIYWDSRFSYNGFIRMGLSHEQSLPPALMIAAIQIGVATMRMAGREPFTMQATNGFEKFILFSVVTLYLLDIASNAIEFGAGLSVGRILDNFQDLNSWGMLMIALGLAIIFTFGDDILTRYANVVTIQAGKIAIADRMNAGARLADKRYAQVRNQALIAAATDRAKTDVSTWQPGSSTHTLPPSND